MLLRNDGLEPVPLDWVQVSLYSPEGLAQAATAQGSWQVPPRETLTVEVPRWCQRRPACGMGRVTVSSAGRVSGQPASGSLSVAAPDVRVLAVSPSRAVYGVGALISVDVLLRNSGSQMWRADALAIEGVPGGAHWEAP